MTKRRLNAMTLLRNNKTALKIGAILAVCLGLLIAFGPNPQHESALRPASARTKPAQLEFPALDGGNWRIEDHRGKVVLVNFWATWCPPCRAETPGLVRLSKDFRDRGLVVAGVALDEGGVPAVRGFIREFRVPYDMLLPGDSVLAANIGSLPTTLLFDRNGRAAASYLGAVHQSDLQHDIERLLAEP